MTPAHSAKRQSLGLFTIAFLVLGTLSIVRTPADWRDEWDLETTLLISNSVYRKCSFGWSEPMGYPYDPSAKDRGTRWYSDDASNNYYKQFGLPVYVLALLTPRDAESMIRFLLGSRYVVALAGSAIIALLVTLFAQRCGIVTGLALLLFLAADRQYGIFLHSLYWQAGLSLLPLLAIMTTYTPAVTPGRLRMGLALFSAAVCLRSLCGYEHVSVLVLTACAAVVFCGRPAKWTVLARHSIWFIVAGSLGVLIALLIHGGSLYLLFGSVDEVIRYTVRNAIDRSLGTHEHMREASTLRAHLFGIYGILAQNKLLTALLGIWGLTLATWLAKRCWRGESRSSPLLETGAAASGLAFLAACSWVFLMRVHIAVAPQYNGLLFFHGFVWFAIPFLTTALQSQMRPVDKAFVEV